MQQLASSIRLSGGVLRLALLLSAGFVFLTLYYVVLWPLAFVLSQGPWFTYDYLNANQALWEQLYRLLAWLPWLSPWAAPSLPLLSGLWVLLFSSLFALYLAAFFLLRWTARAGSRRERRLALAIVLVLAAAAQFVLLLSPGILTTDVFSYVMYGRIAGVYGGNPFVDVPALYPTDLASGWIAPMWQTTPSVYGPLWIDISALISQITAAWGAVGQVMAYRALLNLAHFTSIVLFAAAVRKLSPAAALPSTLLFAWSPLLLFELSANAHNDALMLTLALAAFVCCTRRWMAAALVALVLSAMVKYVTLLVVPIFLLYWARQQLTLRRKFAVVVGGGLATVAIVAALYAPWYAGAATFAALRGWTTTPLYANSPTDILARDLALLLDPARESQVATLERVRTAAKWIALTALAAHLAWETWRVRTLRGVAAASARVLLTFLLVASPWVLPWYFTWPLMFGLLAGWDSSTGRLTVLFSLTAPAVLHYLGLWGNTPQAGLWNALYLAPLALPIAAWIAGRKGSASVRLARSDGAEQGTATDPRGARAA